MLKEVFAVWESNSQLPVDFNVDEISEHNGTVTLLLNQLEGIDRARIIFDNNVVFYRSTDESFWICPDSPIKDSEGNRIYQYSTFKVINSKLILWIQEESCGIADKQELIHFLFIDSNFFIDVVATSEPRIERISDVNRKME